MLDAIRARKERFMFEDVEIVLRSTVMAFITMNPGYPGEHSAGLKYLPKLSSVREWKSSSVSKKEPWLPR